MLLKCHSELDRKSNLEITRPKAIPRRTILKCSTPRHSNIAPQKTMPRRTKNTRLKTLKPFGIRTIASGTSAAAGLPYDDQEPLCDIPTTRQKLERNHSSSRSQRKTRQQAPYDLALDEKSRCKALNRHFEVAPHLQGRATPIRREGDRSSNEGPHKRAINMVQLQSGSGNELASRAIAGLMPQRSLPETVSLRPEIARTVEEINTRRWRS